MVTSFHLETTCINVQTSSNFLVVKKKLSFISVPCSNLSSMKFIFS